VLRTTSTTAVLLLCLQIAIALTGGTSIIQTEIQVSADVEETLLTSVVDVLERSFDTESDSDPANDDDEDAPSSGSNLVYDRVANLLPYQPQVARTNTRLAVGFPLPESAILETEGKPPKD
jgi:hypothetical protein